MAKNKIGLEVKGFEEMITHLDELEGDLNEAVSGCLRVANNTVASKLEQDIHKHKRTGLTAGSIVTKANVKWEGSMASVDVGFDLKKGGMPSIFLMYGTPRMAKDQSLYDDIYGTRTKREIAKKQEAIMSGMIKKRMGG